MKKKIILGVMLVFGLAFFSCDNDDNGTEEYRIFKNQSSYTVQVIFTKFDNLSEYDASLKSFSLSPGQERKVVYSSDFQCYFEWNQPGNVKYQFDGAHTFTFYD